MRIARDVPRQWVAASLALAMAAAPIRPRAAAGSPIEYLPVGDPIEAELRTLDVLGPEAAHPALRLPHLSTRPLQRFEADSLPFPDRATDAAHRIALARIWRVLAREGEPGEPDGVTGRTPRLYQHRYSQATRFEVSAGLEGVTDVVSDRLHPRSDTGMHARIALETDRWLAFSHLVVGHQDTARAFADPVFRGTDIITHTGETYFAYTAESRHWGVQFGRSRWQWGPGEEGTLLLSGSAPPITALAFHARLEPLHADGTAISATLASAAGEQLAAHRIEWQLRDGLRFGLSEAARYRSPSWQALYVLGVIPYILVQRLQDQDEPAARAAHRNNILVGADLAWRLAPGLRVYTEWLADDLHLGRSAAAPNRYAYQVGGEAAWTVRGTRLVGGAEWTRVNRYVYTSAFGRDFTTQGQPLGFPFAPDARRIRVRAAWDPSAAWQLTTVFARTNRGENTLAEPFRPGDPPVQASRFQGVVEATEDLEAGARWWPAGGLDLSAVATCRWTDNVAHVPGTHARSLGARLAFRVVR